MEDEKKQVEHACEACGNHIKGWDLTMTNDECGGCCSWNDKWIPKSVK